MPRSQPLVQRRAPAAQTAGAHAARHRRAPVISVHAVSKTYSLGEIAVHALRGVTLQIERGDFVAIMGSSGSGKSTLMNTNRWRASAACRASGRHFPRLRGPFNVPRC